MSGIVGSYFNTRGSGVVAKLGTDGQIFTSAGAGLSQGFEAAPGGGKILQVVSVADNSNTSTSAGSYVDTGLSLAITPAATSSKILVLSHTVNPNKSGSNDVSINLNRIISGGSYAELIKVGVGECWNQDTTENRIGTSSCAYLDSPSTTSECTYKTQMSSSSGEINSGGNSTSTMTLMEIGA